MTRPLYVSSPAPLLSAILLISTPAAAIGLNPFSAIKGAIEGFVDDAVIETKINAQLLDAKGVNVTNFRWRSAGGKGERDNATDIVRDIDNVTAVKNLAKIKPKT